VARKRLADMLQAPCEAKCCRDDLDIAVDFVSKTVVSGKRQRVVGSDGRPGDLWL